MGVQDGVVYRGISPDVLVIDRKGRLQVGLSRHVGSSVAYVWFVVHLPVGDELSLCSELFEHIKALFT